MRQTLMKPSIKEIVLNEIAKNRQIIYGQRATNFFLNKNLRKKTKDYDILTKKPRKSAEDLAKKLNKFYKDRYKVVQAMHRKTFKVKDIQTGETIADFTGTTKKPKAYNQLGVRYANLDYSKRKLKKAIKDPMAGFRKEKDIDILGRIKTQEKYLW